jgi:hypothetical protein
VAEPVVLVAGGDPLQGLGGHSAYVRAHGRAARRAGFEPHVLCTGSGSRLLETDFGLLHRISPSWEPAWLSRHRGHQLVWRFRRLACAAAALVRAHPRVRIVHGFGVFASSAVLACQTLSRERRTVVPIASAYDTMVREGRAKLRGVSRSHGAIQRLVFAAELAWIRTAVERWERRGYVEARLVLVNYESMRRLLTTSYGLDRTLRKIPYSPETAFREPGPRPAPPATLAAPRAGPLVLAVSRHDPRKGVDVLPRPLDSFGPPARRSGPAWSATALSWPRTGGSPRGSGWPT